MSKPLPTSKLFSIQQVADHCQVSTKSIRRWIDDGQLHAHRLGRQVRVAHDDLAAFLSARRR